jgi:hypothetical protein
MEEVKCSFCGADMEIDTETSGPREIKPEEAMVYCGGINWFTLGYGSKFDLEQWLLAICDGCLENCKPLKKKDYYIK